MSVIVYGQRLCGQVERVPGLFYVSTLFWHCQFIPLFPVCGYLVKEGSENGPQLQGVRISMSPKSLLAAYLRCLLAAIGIFAGVVAAMATTGFYLGLQNYGIIAALVAVTAVVAALWYIMMTHSRWFLPLQLAFLLASAAVYLDARSRVPDTPRVIAASPSGQERLWHDGSYINTLLIANAATLLFTLTRLLTPASYAHALELGRLMGVPPAQIALRLGLDPALAEQHDNRFDRRARPGGQTTKHRWQQYHCEVCGFTGELEPSNPLGDASCPQCNSLLWPHGPRRGSV